MKRRYGVVLSAEDMEYVAFVSSRANTKAGLVKAAKVALNVRFGSEFEPEFGNIRYMVGRTSEPLYRLQRLGWFQK